MKKILLAALWLPLMALAQSYPSPTYQNLTVLGTTHEGAVAVTGGTIDGTPIGATTRSTGAFTALSANGSFTATGLVTTADLATQAANTVLANATGSAASPAAFAMPSCNTSASALTWTSSTGFTCNSAVIASNVSGVVAVANGGSGTASPGGVDVTAAPYSAACNGSTNDAAAFASALAANKIVRVPNTGSPCLIGTTQTWPAGTVVVFAPGAAITVSTGITVTIQGQVGHDSTANIFQGAGTVTGLAWVRPEWWGATGTGTAHNDAPAVQSAVNSMEASSGSDGNPCVAFQGKQYGIGSTVTVTMQPPVRTCMEGTGASGTAANTPTEFVGLATFTGTAVFKFTGNASGASPDWNIGDFSVYPQTVGSGPTVGIQIGYGTNTLQGAFHEALWHNIHVQDFGTDWGIANARLMRFDNVSGWSVNNASGTSLLITTSAASSSNFSGDMEFIGSQFVGVVGGYALQILSPNGSGATVGGVKFHGTDFYLGGMSIASTGGGNIQDIWFDSGFQYDGINGAVAFVISSSGSGSTITDVHVTDGYFSGAPTVIPINISSVSSGKVNGIYIKGNLIQYTTTLTTSAVLALSGVTGGIIADNDFIDVGTGTNAVMSLSNDRNIQVVNNTAEQRLFANVFAYFVYINTVSDYYNITGNLSNGIATNGTTQNANVGNPAAGAHANVSGNW